MWLFDSKAEIIGWVVAILVVTTMGVLAFAGPFHHISHTEANSFKLVRVNIVTDAATIGAYQPKVITLHVGQQAVFHNVSNVDHTVTAASSKFDSANIATNASWTYTATQVGKFPYICSYHPLMHGTVVVIK